MLGSNRGRGSSLTADSDAEGCVFDDEKVQPDLVWKAANLGLSLRFLAMERRRRREDDMVGLGKGR